MDEHHATPSPPTSPRPPSSPTSPRSPARHRGSGATAAGPSAADPSAAGPSAAADPAAGGPSAAVAPEEMSGGDLRSRVQAFARKADELLAAAGDDGIATAGRLGALVDLAHVADRIQAVMVTLASEIEPRELTQRTGLRLDELLAARTRMTGVERRGLVRTSAELQRMPALAEAFGAGLVGAGEVRSVLAKARRLDADGRAVLDLDFEDHARLQRLDADTVVDEVAAQASRWAARKLDDDRVKAYERRFLAVQPGLDDTLAGHFELDTGTGGIVLRALDDAAVPLTGPRALRGDAVLDPERIDPDRRTLARRRADALVALAEHWLDGRAATPTQAPTGVAGVAGDAASRQPGAAREPGGDRPLGSGDVPPSSGDAPPTFGDGPRAGRSGSRRRPPRRARPLVYVWTDIRTLTGEDGSSAAPRLLWDALGPAPVLTATAARRLASDARLQFVLADGGEVLGVAAPTSSIPAKVRAAVHARDQGCRFPACRAPISQTDVHHVVGREQGGWTVVENLVALCRRHHTAVTDARWILTMRPDGAVKVRRGRHVATSDPPVTRRL
jgi:hypothetical protein